MNRILSNLKPKEVFHYFEEISEIPRGSGNEQEISNYLVQFAKNNNLEYFQDEFLNVIIKKPGTNGYENSPIVILQGHMDIVCEKSEEIYHDFLKDPLKLRINEDFVKATGTTLGADNGIAVAYALAILASKDIQHPPIEVLITTEEETGMGGAANLDGNMLEGKILINIDSEEEGELLTSCAGGVRSKVKLPINWVELQSEYKFVMLKIKGLKGGHSGMEIVKGRGVASKLIGRVLFDIAKDIEFYLSSIKAGAKMNAIPRNAEATLLISDIEVKKLSELVDKWNEIFKNELKGIDDDVLLEMNILEEKSKKVFSKKTRNRVINILTTMPQGVQTMSNDICGLVQSSTNLGVVSTEEDCVMFESAVRSSIGSLKDEITNRIKVVAKVNQAKQTLVSSYPEWQYKKDSYIRDLFGSVYEKMYGDKPKITAIHAGLECGLLKEKLGDIDMISFGPNMFDVHTPEERLSISSTERTWKYLLKVLKEIK
ncbi:aminoacyl-histidine dipeptidase [Clostridium grantii]|uniref:Cytosol non-specific dipeptidase n=1 Tax=Clostridium grantii DSM 8605 TaxID=1121316 RepID=A0A1M5V8G0_9CLOT|nr:aminoacyl-histidine dipeptidase [Clostridium grantii]SHH71515.1 dipeptidase D [Clostridium grantii DSM 8605]